MDDPSARRGIGRLQWLPTLALAVAAANALDLAHNGVAAGDSGELLPVLVRANEGVEDDEECGYELVALGVRGRVLCGELPEAARMPARLEPSGAPDNAEDQMMPEARSQYQIRSTAWRRGPGASRPL